MEINPVLFFSFFQPQLFVTEEMGVPKLTLRIGSDSPRPSTPEAAAPLAQPTAPKMYVAVHLYIFTQTWFGISLKF